MKLAMFRDATNRTSPNRKPAGGPRCALRRHAYSMSEMIITISVIGVLAGLVVPSLTGTLAGSKEAIANDRLELLNQALNEWAHAFKEYSMAPQDGSASDELTILLDLEYRNPDANKTLPGSPFVEPRYRPQASSNTADYRIVWAGYRFKLLRPGQSGTGIKIPFDGSDYGTPYTYPSNFSTSGR